MTKKCQHKSVIIVIFILISLLVTMISLGVLHIAEATTNNSENNLGNQISSIVDNFIGKVKNRITSSSSCFDIGIPSTGTETQNFNGNNSSYRISGIGSGSGNKIVSSSISRSSSTSSALGSMALSESGEDHSNNIVSILGGSDDQTDDSIICGSPGNDILVGSSDNNIIYGGAGYDKLFGGPKNDILIGGPGADYFDCGPGNDTIRDYHPSEGDTKTNDCENY
jgi:Ca2+-binding RTX toxin-like protein